jgi:tetratricopeptide (TPR) repeat protein
MNPFNPSIYLSLASFEARQKKYDDSIRDLGKALQVKNNYLDAIFLLSQVYAAKGDIVNAVTAAKVAVELNPQSPQLLFQLGILDYNIKDYAGAVQALDGAVKIQKDYANAKYFLGLSYARLNNIVGAVSQFEDLARTNPENQEVALILANLKNGKSIFADAKASAPEKRASLPIKEKR